MERAGCFGKCAEECRPSGQVYEGTWTRNLLTGEVKIEVLGKETIKTHWKNGVLVSGVKAEDVH